MGRNIHYDILNADKLTVEELDIIVAITEKYVENVRWTCQPFCIDPHAFDINGDALAFRNVTAEKRWEKVNRFYGMLRGKGWNHGSVVRELVRIGWVKLTAIVNGRLESSQRIAGNEWNAMQAYRALIDISVKTDAEIRFMDDGYFLYAPVLIRDGKARVDETMLANGEPSDELGKRLKKAVDTVRYCYPSWTEPMNLCRPVKERDFVDFHDYFVGDLCAGSGGEYWGIVEGYDAERESYMVMADVVNGVGVALGGVVLS